MEKRNALPFLLLVVLLMLSFSAHAQLTTPQPSPLAKVSQNVGLAEVSLTYSRPAAKGRTIYGDLVPYDKLWRTGANRPTRIRFSEEVLFEGNKVPAGEYTLITIPGKAEWTVILNKDSKGNGVFSYLESDDVLRVKVKPTTLSNHVESFTLGFAEVMPATANLEILWEKTSVKIKIEHHYAPAVEAQIKRLTDPNRDASLFYQIASYYYDSGDQTKMKDALDLITKSTDMNPRYWTVHLKAKIQQKMGDKKGAIASAERSMELAKADKSDDYVRLNEKLLAELKK